MIFNNPQRMGWLSVFASCLGLSLGCQGEVDEPPPRPVVLVDSATGDAVLHPPVDHYPAIHPKTGKPTLHPAMFCAQCRKWLPVPTPDRINRVPHATRCPNCRGPLSTSGPPPPAVSRDGQ